MRFEKGSSAKKKDTNLAAVKSMAEKETIIRVLAQCNANISAAARILGISRSVLYDKIKKFDLKIKNTIAK